MLREFLMQVYDSTEFKNDYKEWKSTSDLGLGLDAEEPDQDDEKYVDYLKLTIDLTRVESYRQLSEGGTGVFMRSGEAFNIKIPYNEFSDLIQGKNKLEECLQQV